MNIVLFDMMDTVIREPYFAAVRRLLPGPLTPETYFRWRDRDAHFAFERGEVTEPEHFRSFYLPGTPPELLEQFPRPERVKKELLRSLRYFDGIPELLVELYRRPDVRTGVASNYSVWYQQMLPRLREIREQMDYYFYSCEMGVRKPDPGYYQMIAAGLQSDFPDLRPEQIFFTDDRPENTAAASALGWRVHVMTGDTPVLRNAIEAFLADGD